MKYLDLLATLLVLIISLFSPSHAAAICADEAEVDSILLKNWC